MIIIKNKTNISFFILLSIISTIVSCDSESKVSKQSTISPESTIVSEPTINPIKYNCSYWNKSIGKGFPDKPKNILVSGSELGYGELGDLYEEKWDECFVFLDKSKEILVIEAIISWYNSKLNIINTQKKIFELGITNKQYIEKTVDIVGGKETFNGLTPMFNKHLATYKIENDTVVNKTIIYLEETGNSLIKEGSDWAKFDWRQRVELDTIAYENLFSGKISKVHVELDTIASENLFPGKLSEVNPELTKLTKGMPYSQVRQILFTHGWKAHNDKIEEYEYDTPSYKDLVIDKGYKEYLFCSGTGLGICSFKFINDQHQSVEILTAGDPQGSVFHKIFDLKTSPDLPSKTDKLP
jgi:hypothetical protein